MSEKELEAIEVNQLRDGILYFALQLASLSRR
jgi:hypothetical protein